ncbi:hypothetical protein [Streptomyces sp. NBC_01618]|uniref:hypothetical protein n=1 Tax=Streptomyces sp. NBC_01618 TaxID=2975900 RepID=UPI003868B359|nr:hypothetical protein OH735_14315 [Streptomyces sp. NBC_01618]
MPRAWGAILMRVLATSEEQEAGLHVPGAKKRAAPKRTPKPKMDPKLEDGIQDGFF